MTARGISAHSRFLAVRQRLERFEPGTGWRSWAYEFALFGFKQGWACLFGGLLVGFVCVLIVDWQDLQAQRRAEARPRVPRPPDFPPQRKHDIA